MGQKADRIKELESRLGVAQTFIRSVGEIMGVAVGDDVNAENMPRYLGRFSAQRRALVATSHSPATEFDGDDDDVAPPPFDALVDQEIDRANAPRALVPFEGASASSTDALTTTEREGLGAVMDIARELGVDVAGVELPAALSRIYQSILKIKSPGDVGGDDQALTKGDSLAQAIQFGRDAEHHLRDELARVRALVGRIAGAMQLRENWTANGGEEILERIQRWEGIKHILRRRIKLWESRDSDSDSGVIAVAVELRAVLAHIVAPAELAKLLENKPRAVFTPTVLAAIEHLPLPATEKKFTPITVGDLEGILDAAEAGAKNYCVPHPDRLVGVIHGLRHSPVAVRGDLVNFINLVTLPCLETA